MTIKQAFSVDYSVLPATQESENLVTIRIDLRLPQGIVHPSSNRFYEILGDLALLHSRKQADYGRGDDPFANVRASQEWGVRPWIGALIRLNDKVRRLQSLATKGELKNESADDSLRDIAVYAVIALVLLEQELSPQLEGGSCVR